MKRIKYIFIFTLVFVMLFSFTSMAATGSNVESSFEKTFPIVPDKDGYREMCSVLYSVDPDVDSLVGDMFSYVLALENTQMSFDVDYSYYVVSDIYGQVWVFFWDPERFSHGTCSFSSSDSHKEASITFHFKSGTLKYDDVSNKYICPAGFVVITYDSLRNGYIYNFDGMQTESGGSFTFPILFSAPIYSTGMYQPSPDGWYFWNQNIVSHYGENLTFMNGATNEIYVFPYSNIGGDIDYVIGDESILHEIEDSDTFNLGSYLKSAFSGILGYIGNMFASLSNEIFNAIKTIVGNIGNSISNIKDLLEDFFSNFDPFFTMVNEFYSYGILSDGSFDLILMLETIFIPDQDYIDAKTEEFYNTNFFWIDSVFNSVNSLFGMLERAALSSVVPEIIIPAGTYGHFVLENDVVWSFSWYLPFKAVADLVIAAFIYLFFFYRIVTSLPNIISGVGSPFVRGTIAFEKSAVKKASIAPSRRKGG